MLFHFYTEREKKRWKKKKFKNYHIYTGMYVNLIFVVHWAVKSKCYIIIILYHKGSWKDIQQVLYFLPPRVQESYAIIVIYVLYLLLIKYLKPIFASF